MARFEHEVMLGNLPQNFPSADRAKLMFDLRQGMVFRARAGFTDDDLAGDIDKYVSSVLASCES